MDPERFERVERIETITSPANPTLKLARSLHRRRARLRERALLVEGARAILGALEHGARFRVLLLDASRADDVDAALLERLRAVTPRTLAVAPQLFAEVADTEHPQPLIAICEMPDLPFPTVCTLVLALDGVRDPGNVGTLLRAAAGAGADGIWLLPGTVDVYNPKVVRASAGALFAIPVAQRNSLKDATSTSDGRPTVVLADGDAELAYDAFDWSAPVVLVVGGEAEGISREVRTYADTAVRIPLARDVESLNAAVAGAVLLFEAARQRRGARA